MGYFSKKLSAIVLLVSAALFGFVFSLAVQAQQPEMSFFITSAGPGNGGNLGGLAGADAHCT